MAGAGVTTSNASAVSQGTNTAANSPSYGNNINIHKRSVGPNLAKSPRQTNRRPIISSLGSVYKRFGRVKLFISIFQDSSPDAVRILIT